MVDFMEVLWKKEVLKVLKFLSKTRTESEIKEALKDIQQKMELHTAECEGMHNIATEHFYENAV